MAALSGLKILDLSRVLAGPWATQLLAELGATVIKVEGEQQEDETRSWGPPFLGDLSAYFACCNRNKILKILDLKSQSDHKKLMKIAETCDVVVSNFLPRTQKSLRLTHRDFRKVQPKIVTCSITGFSPRGSYADRPGYDFAIQALSGLMSITGEVNGAPMKCGVAVVDVLTGLYAVCGILAAVHAGGPRNIDVNLMHVALASQINVIQAHLITKKPAKRYANAHAQIAPYEMFEAKDGNIVIAVGNDRQFRRLAETLQNRKLHENKYSSNPLRIKNRKTLASIINSCTRGYSLKNLCRMLDAAEIPNSPVLDHGAALRWLEAAGSDSVVKFLPFKGKKKLAFIRNPINGLPLAKPALPPKRSSPRQSKQRRVLL